MNDTTVATPPIAASPDAEIRDPSDCLGNFAVWTPEIELLASAILGWIALDLPGGCMHGMQRTGKSCAIDYIAGSAEDYFGSKVLVSRLVVPESLADRENAWTAETLIQHGLIARARDGAVLKQRLLGWYKEMMEALRSQRVLLLVDEAQNLTRFHHGQLMYWHNLLEREGMRPFTLLIGQPELEAISASYVTTNELQVTGRFYERTHEFKGIALDDITPVLKGFEQPALVDGVEQSCGLEKLFPRYWREGWRVSSWAPCIAQAITGLAQRRSLPGPPRLPMMHLRALVIGGLKEMQRVGERMDTLPPLLLERIFAQTGLATAIDRYFPTSATRTPRRGAA